MPPALQLTQKKLDRLVKSAIREELKKIFNDPDFGLPYHVSFLKKVRASLRSKKEGRVISLDEVVKKMKLKV